MRIQSWLEVRTKLERKFFYGDGDSADRLAQGVFARRIRDAEAIGAAEGITTHRVACAPCDIPLNTPKT